MHLRISAALAVFCAGVTIPIVKGQTAQNFVAVTPCRVADTRVGLGPLGGPIMDANETRSFPVLSSACNIPTSATAYSLNVTVVVPSFSLSYLTIWPTGQPQPNASTLNSSVQVIANAAIVPAGTNGAISVFVTDQTEVVLDIDGYFVAATALANGTEVTVGTGSTLSSNLQSYDTAVGIGALIASVSGGNNTAIGAYTLASNNSYDNTAVGTSALNSNGTGDENTAVGSNALSTNTSGRGNSAFGFNSMAGNNGGGNTALGVSTLHANASGSGNVAVGTGALLQASGDYNIAIGSNAGGLFGTGDWNIEIGNQGTLTDSGIIRIGDANQTSTYISGIVGANPGGGNAVLITPSGQLYSPNSSRRYKDDIRSMGEASDALMDLRPVTFRYKQSAQDGTKPLEYGLIAEEVAKIYPELVVYGKDGRVESVQYYQLPALLLNEVQKEHKVIQEKTEQIQALELRVAALEQLIRGRVEQTASVH